MCTQMNTNVRNVEIVGSNIITNNSIYPPVDISALWQTQIYLIQRAFYRLNIIGSNMRVNLCGPGT